MTAETSDKANWQSTEQEQGEKVIIKGQQNTEKTLNIHRPHHNTSK